MSSKKPALLEESEENETYATGGFKNNSHGFNYQLRLLMLVFYRLVKKYHKFKLATEIAAAGEFDDIVFEYEDEEGQTKVILVQCKHKIEENDTKLCQLKNDFSLEKHFSSYIKIINDNMIDKKTIKSLILYTNAMSNNSRQTKERLVEIKAKDKVISILQFPDFKKLNSLKPKFYKINIQSFCSAIQKDLDSGKITQTDVKEFETKFILAINQPNAKELDDIIKKEMGEEFSFVDSELVVNNLYCYMHKWMSDQKGKFITEEVGEVFFKELKEKINQTEIEGVLFENLEKNMIFGRFFETTKDLENKIALANGSFLHVKSNSPSLTIIKIVQLLENRDNYLVLNFATLFALMNIVKDTFISQQEFTMYVECTSLDKQIMSQAIAALRVLLDSAINGTGNKGIVLVSHKRDEFVESLKTGYAFTTIDDSSSYDDLTLSARERMIDYDVNFQGCNIKLREIVNENWEEILDEEIVNRIVEKDEIKIGKPVEMTKEISSIYINRRLEINMERIKKKYKDKTEEEIMDIAKTQSENKICIIEGGPGFGKSTELINMALQEKYKNKTMFLLSMNLLDYTNIYDEVKEFGKDSLTNFLIKRQSLDTEFEINILKHQLFVSGRMILFLDGFDEISPMYENTVISLIKVLKNETKVRQIWVTTRSHAFTILDQAFESAIYQLRPFDENDRKEFLQKYWIQLLKARNNDESIALFADKVLVDIYDSEIEEVKELIGIPLHMRMIAEVFADKCKECWEGKGHFEIDLKGINVYELFKAFINKKFEIYFREKAKLDHENPRIKMFVKNELKRVKRELQKMAFRLIFPNDCAVFVKSSKEKIDTELLSVGIIQKTNDSPVFIHPAFAEYFAAEFLAENLKHDNKNAELMGFLNCNNFKLGNHMIHYFYDNILADLEIHMATIKMT